MIDPILITGAARSGTSLTAGIIDYCGAYGGAVSGPTRYNRKGQFENDIIRQTIVKPLLRDELGVDPMGQHPLPSIEMVWNYLQFAGDHGAWLRAKIETIFSNQGYEKGLWYYKGAKMCLLWPIWHTAFPSAKWIIVRRADAEIVNSCCRTGFMRAFRRRPNEAECWQGWVDHHKARFAEMLSETNAREVWPRKFVDGDLSEIKGVVSWLGLEWDEKRVLEFIEQALYRGASNGR